MSGSLLSHDALNAAFQQGPSSGDSGFGAARRRLRELHSTVGRKMGPASSARAVYDRVAVPLMAELGFLTTLVGTVKGDMLRALLMVHGRCPAAILVTAWGREPAGAWRDGVLLGIGSSVPWCICINGRVLRVFDARRTYSRRYVEFDLAATVQSSITFNLFWALFSAAGFSSGSTSALDEAVRRSEAHRTEVRVSLQEGVQDAVQRLIRAFACSCRPRVRPTVGALFDESLIVLYRVLFLLFAEARGLVPKWHPVYRHSYTIESLRDLVERHPQPRGVWEAVQAISRLAHRGCHARTLRVPPFNGRLFSPAHAPLADTATLDDGEVREVLIALTTRRTGAGRERISYADLGVEQLGGVYERVLDFEPAWDDGRSAVRFVPSVRRKATGAFYTPRSLTEYMVRRTLAPIVHQAAPDQILSLRVLDPAMGSGAFLVAACRYLAAAYEAALVRDGVVAATDVSEADRAGFRRAIAQRCLFGVDINPMAVQLGRLSLWLATLSADKPLTFLDHHLRAGNSLLGASLADVARRPVSRGRTGRGGPLPLFDESAADGALGATIAARVSIANGPGDTLDEVRGKERAMAGLMDERAPLARWKQAADLWCAGWFDDGISAAGHARGGTFNALLDEVLGRSVVLPGHISAPLLDRSRATAVRERFFHWSLEFPEVFCKEDGRPLSSPGFDALVGNPPWEVLRGDRGEQTGGLAAFARGSGTYFLQGGGHPNLFQLFLERALALIHPGGRLGIVLPSGFASDHGCATLRRHLLERTSIDTFVSIENRDGLFPIHRALKFLLLTTTGGGATEVLSCRFRVRAPEVLDELPDIGTEPEAVAITGALIARLSGEQRAVPELRSPLDLSIVARLAFSVPPLGDSAGWGLSFGRELNATEDRPHFVEFDPLEPATRRSHSRSYPVVEGKHLRPFVVDVQASSFGVPARTARKLLDPASTYGHPRLAYRDVAAPTNRLTLIAAIVPPRVITTHTLFCLKGRHDLTMQQFLCGVFNSFVANYLVRLWVGMHVTVAIVARLPVPVVAIESAAFADIASLAARLGTQADRGVSAALQARVAHLYGIARDEFRHILGTFPLVPVDERDAAMEAYCAAE